jgi:hypothetical protein
MLFRGSGVYGAGGAWHCRAPYCRIPFLDFPELCEINQDTHGSASYKIILDYTGRRDVRAADDPRRFTALSAAGTTRAPAMTILRLVVVPLRRGLSLDSSLWALIVDKHDSTFRGPK